MCKSVEQARQLTHRVEHGVEYNCRRFKLGFSTDFDDTKSSGYRDAQLNLSCPGSALIFELQVHHKQIYAVKTGLGGGGHSNYKDFRQQKEPILRKLLKLYTELDVLGSTSAVGRTSTSTNISSAPSGALFAPQKIEEHGAAPKGAAGRS